MLWLVGAVLLLCALALAFDSVRPAVWAADVALLGVAAVDLWRTPAPRRVVVDRRLPERAGLSRTFLRSLSLACPAAGGLRVEVHERFPEPFRVVRRGVDGRLVPPPAGDPSGGPDTGVFSPSGRLELERELVSDLRGAFAFSSLRVRLRSRWGLFERQVRLDGSQTIGIEPALTDLRRTLRLAASERWRDLGVRRLRRRGGETEFESLREYVHGDDVRRVDWKAFAHRGKPMIRQYQVERGQELILLIDRGRRMRVATTEGTRRAWTKLDWALDACIQLAAVALEKGDRVGVATFERELSNWIAPAKGARQLTRLSQALFELQPVAQDADLGRALRELATRHRRSATVVVVSDVADPLSVERQRRALAAASRRHRVVFAALDDPDLREASAGQGVPVAVRSTALELAHDRHRSLAALRTSRVRVLDALPSQAAAPLLAAWLDERRR